MSVDQTLFDKAEKAVFEEYQQNEFQFGTRKMEYVEMKYVLYYVLNKIYNLSSYSIGKHYGYNHTTVIHGIKSITDRMLFEKQIAAKVEKITLKMKNI